MRIRLQKFDETIKKIYLKLNKIQKDTEESRTKTSRNSAEIVGLKFPIKTKNKQINRQNKTITDLEREIEELKNKSLRKILVFKNIKHHQVNENS